MFAILALAAAAAAELPPRLQGPVPIRPAKPWVDDIDWPGSVPRETGGGEVQYALTVSKEGRVIDCTIEGASGEPVLDTTTCRLLRSRARFTPAKLGDGSLAIGVYRGSVSWRSLTTPQKTRYGMAMRVQRLPPGLADPAIVFISVSADETGRVDDCAQPAPLTGTSAFAAARNGLVQMACPQALKGLKVVAAKDQNGTPVRSVQQVTVIFTAIDKTPLPPAASVIPPDFPAGVQMIRENGIYVVRTPAGDMPLYTYRLDPIGLEKITKANKPACIDACTANWPPFWVQGEAKPIGKWTIIGHDLHLRQWAYEGKPVYLKRDALYGSATGDGEGDLWHVLRGSADQGLLPP